MKKCKCGCGRVPRIASRNKWVNGVKIWEKGKPQDFVNGHNRRILKRYKVDDDGCWIWLLHKSHNGYGRLRLNGKNIFAHRYYYEKYKGKIPKELQIDHLCKVRLCINPEHLEAVTITTNVRRSSSVKLNPSQVRKIREMAKLGIYSHEYIAKFFPVRRETVSTIIRGETWIDVV